MSPIFSPGNLITLVVAVFLVLLLRQLDKSKQPLDKLRRYADKLKEDLAAFTAEKEEAIKSYGVSLDVEQQAARELMKRLQLTDQDLTLKAAAVAKIDQRISAYDATLEELIQMTARVEENLSRLKDESAFVEDTSLQVRGLREKLSALEQDLGSLEHQFRQENDAALEETREGIIAALRSSVRDLETQTETIERRVEDHREFIDQAETGRAERLEQDRIRIEEILARSLEEAARRADKLEDAALVKLRDHAQDRVNKIKTTLEEKIKTYQESAKTRVGELQELLRQQRGDAKTAAAEFALTLKEQRQDWQADEAALAAAALARQQTWKRNLAEGEEALRSLETFVAAQKEQLDAALAGQKNHIESGLEDLRRQWTALSGELQTSIERQEQKWLQASADMDAATERQREYWTGIASALESTLETQRTTWDSAAASFQTALDDCREQIETLTAAHQEARTESAAALDQALTDHRDRMETALAAGQNTLTQTLQAQAEELETSLQTRKDQFDAALAAHSARVEEALSIRQEETDAALEAQKQEWEALAAKHQETLREQLDEWHKTTGETARQLLEESERRLESYRTSQAEEFRRLAAASDDAVRLEEELRRVMEEAEIRIRSDFARFEEEAEGFRKEAAAGFDTQAAGFKTVLEELRGELTELKDSARATASKNLEDFEDQFFADLAQRKAGIDRQFTEWRETVEKRLDALGKEGIARRGELETALTEESRKTLAAQGEKLITGLEQLRKETASLEAGIREEMSAADEARQSFRDQLAGDLEELRLSAESTVKVEIGRHTLSAQEIIKQSQRDLESRLKELTDILETRNSEIRASQDRVREIAESNDNRIAQFRQDLDKAREEAAAQRQELLTRTQEEARDISAAVEEAERRIRDFTAQTRLFERTDELKAELERRVEDLRADLDRLDQRKSEIAQMEGEFTRIKRLGDDVGAKMNRFLMEQRRVESMEADFNRLIQTSRAVEEKLTQVSNSDDTLEAVQIQIRRLEDALRETEEKYQRVERKNQTLEETNAGIARNFRALRDSEAALTRVQQGQEDLSLRMETLRNHIETLAAESEKARTAAEQLGILDESLTSIERRIKDMQKAREWLAALETRMEELYRQAQDHVKMAGEIVNRDSLPSYDDKSAITPAARENVIKLARRGWTVKEISNSVRLSEGAVELILEVAPRDS